MSDTDYDIEKLITRRLDGELDEDGQLEVNRALIRDPQARSLMEDCQRIDELAKQALRETLMTGEISFDPESLTTSVPKRRINRVPRSWWLIPGAIAAAVLALVIPYPSVAPPPGPSTAVLNGGSVSPNPTIRDTRPSPWGTMRTVGTGSPQIQRNTGREVFGVVGDDGNIYWIEVDRTRTLRRAGQHSTKPTINETF